jgi:polyphosphate:AMP phosphotransferase
MFEAVELGQKLDKQSFKKQERVLRTQLNELQRKLVDASVSTLIIVAGVEGAGKGDVVNRLNKWLDTRGIQTHAFWDETDEELERPDYWRYWKRMPARGSISVMFCGWYGDPVVQHMRGEISDSELDEATGRINQTERMLCQDGMLIIKLWLHLSHKKHVKRAKKKLNSKTQVPALEGNLLDKEQYQSLLTTAERTLRNTDTGASPWCLVEGDDTRFRDMSVGLALQEAMERRLKQQVMADTHIELPEPVAAKGEHALTILDKVDLDASLSEDEYREKLKFYQARIHELSWKAFLAHRSTVLVFEGWDASGKGGVIRRLISPVDARLYRVISVAAPTDEELAHHYLWRFWRQVPRSGYMTLYDRSWYGRVLVERVEGFASPDEWRSAYLQINHFEEQLTDHGIILQKFWLHISPEEQLERFRDREKTPWKMHKITDEDWRNRESWDDYKAAVNDMIAHTSTSNAPWHLIPSNSKPYARIKVLKTVCKAMEKALEH